MLGQTKRNRIRLDLGRQQPAIGPRNPPGNLNRHDRRQPHQLRPRRQINTRPNRRNRLRRPKIGIIHQTLTPIYKITIIGRPARNHQRPKPTRTTIDNQRTPTDPPANTGIMHSKQPRMIRSSQHADHKIRAALPQTNPQLVLGNTSRRNTSRHERLPQNHRNRSIPNKNHPRPRNPLRNRHMILEPRPPARPTRNRRTQTTIIDQRLKQITNRLRIIRLRSNTRYRRRTIATSKQRTYLFTRSTNPELLPKNTLNNTRPIRQTPHRHPNTIDVHHGLIQSLLF